MRIAIAGAHRVFAGALESLLRRSGHEIAVCAVGLDAAASAVAREQADVCVLDADLPGARRPGAIENAMAASPGTAFVVLADSSEAEELARAVAAGVHGAALKTDDFVEFLRVLTGASGRVAGRPAGRAVLSLAAQAALRPVRQNLCYPELARLLTRREHEVLARLVHGESTTSMARSMGVRLSTTRTYVDSVLFKLGVHSRLEAVAYAVREGIIDVAEPRSLGEGEDGEPNAISG